MTFPQVLGLHHVTAIASNAQRNYDFYTQILGLRLVKKTVNFDDPFTYHFYYGNYYAAPGTILTFFPWTHISKGRRGVGMATEVGLSVPEGSLGFWKNRLQQAGVIVNSPATKFGEEYLTALDPDGLKLELTVAKNVARDTRLPFETSEIDATKAICGFHHTTLTLSNIQPTAEVLTDILGYRLTEQDVNRYRFVTDTVTEAAIIDLVEAPGEASGVVAGGSVHHIAFRVQDDAAEMALREKIVAKGFHVTPPIDRMYFHSLYFREPGGVLFEIATDVPGFTIDEPLESLGTTLKLPPQYEPRRTQIEAALPRLIV
ncbi:MAG: ring-cleaving dioxygenase [Cytophagales bacterium]|nr:ring-cleaving dioxygenase [Bernardetiaceae bacterium]MDW8204193.1 ring-cleaving dioxygenase [Cytophagales bacterium]